MQKVIEIEFYSNGKRMMYDVSFDTEEVQNFRDQIASELSNVEHHRHISYMNPTFLSSKKYERIEIRNQHKSYLPGIDTWPLIDCSYDKAVFPYLVRILDRILEKGKEREEAIREILNPVLAREYIPIREMIEEYAKVLADGKEFDECNPCFYHSYPYEIDGAEDHILQYTNMLLDNQYCNRFRDAYEKAKILFTVTKKEKNPVKIKTTDTEAK